MAALTWREVTAPQMDTRGLAQAGQAITSSFDRLGDMFIKREDNLRSEATDAAIAQALALQDPEALSKLQAQGLAGLDKRVRGRDYMEALGLRQNQLIDTAKKNEEYLNLKAVGELGDEGQTFVSLYAKGDREGAAKFAATMSEQNPQLWGRVAYQFGLDGEKAYDVYNDNRLADTTERRNAWEGQQEAGARWATVRVAQAAERRQAAEFAQRVADEKKAEQEAKAARGLALQMVGDLKPGLHKDGASVQTLLARNAALIEKRGFSPEVVEKALSLVPAAFDRRFGATDQEKEEATRALNTPGAIGARLTEQRLRADAWRTNPGLQIQERVSKMSPEDIAKLTVPSVTAKLKAAGLGGQAEALVERGLAEGHKLEELAAMADAVPLVGPGLLPSIMTKIPAYAGAAGSVGAMGGPQTAAVAGAIGGAYGLLEGTYDWYSGSPRRADAALGNLRNAGALADAQAKLDESTAGIRQALEQQTRLAARAQQERIANQGKVSKQTQAAIEKVERELAKYVKK